MKDIQNQITLWCDDSMQCTACFLCHESITFAAFWRTHGKQNAQIHNMSLMIDKLRGKQLLPWLCFRIKYSVMKGILQVDFCVTLPTKYYIAIQAFYNFIFSCITVCATKFLAAMVKLKCFKSNSLSIRPQQI